MRSPCPSGRGAPSRGSPGWWTACRRRATRCRSGWCCTRRASWRRAPRPVARSCGAPAWRRCSDRCNGGYRTSSERRRERAMIFELEETVTQNARMQVAGIGGGGGNALNRMVDEGLNGGEVVSVNTDAQALMNNKADVKVQIGKKLTPGLGAGARPEIGRQAIEENRDEVLHTLQGADLVFVTCGMGGGTGTGAAPIISQVRRDLGALTIGICTKPFLFEGRKRMRQAEMGIAEMRKHVDTMIVVPNERLLAVVGKGIPFQDALKKADEVLLHATQGISALICVTGLVNVDFADVRTVMQNGGSALLGTGTGRAENRAMEAAQQAI